MDVDYESTFSCVIRLTCAAAVTLVAPKALNGVVAPKALKGGCCAEGAEGVVAPKALKGVVAPKALKEGSQWQARSAQPLDP